MAFPPETPFTPEALLRRFVKVFYALGLEHASYAEQQKFKTWFNMVWTSLFKYIRGIRPVAWYDARWWRISEGDREKMFNLVCSWEPEARTGELTLDNLPYTIEGIHELKLTEPQEVAHKQEPYSVPDILSIIQNTSEQEIFGVLPHGILNRWRRAIRPSDYNPAAIAGGEAAHALAHSVFGRYSHRQRAIYGL